MPKLTPHQLYDYYDIDSRELKLICVGHAQWTLLRRERRILGQTVKRERALQRGLPTAPPPENTETRCLDAAIQIIARLKRELRAEIKIERAARAAKVREYFQARKGAHAHA